MHTPHPFSEHFPPPWNRIFPYAANIFAWGVLIGLIYLLRSFFLLIFLTFVFSYIQASGSIRLKPYIKNRIVRVTLVALAFISVLTSAGIFLAPKVKTQTEIFASQFTMYVIRVDEELYRLEAKYPILGELLPELVAAHNAQIKEQEVGATAEAPPQTQPRKSLRHSPTAALLQQFLGLGESSNGIQNINQFIDTLGNVGGKVLSITTNFLLSLLFSFLIVLDLPVLGRHVRGLAKTRLRFIYLAVADNIREFSLVLGRALEAQLIIAIINSGLTAIGISLLGLGQNVAFLSVIVFFFSFFPVVGVFISSIPICLVALQSQGLHTMILAIVMITVIHLVEGYILNPRVYGSYMRINSVIILIILTLGGKLFGFWGLLLGVPVCTYIFGYAIWPDKKPKKKISPAAPQTDPAAPDEDPVTAAAAQLPQEYQEESQI
ncbi:MAG: AI-2E family transporter [Desulfobulbaceae bacterium]|nr:AI-2E family transporter [Desulfobulbaceae bacterium]